ncbi:MAG: AAA family ATPase [Deltaproteobacteria bacterium]|nr:AAA family ATPase [Deltaproteobacteria bacterium]
MSSKLICRRQCLVYVTIDSAVGEGGESHVLSQNAIAESLFAIEEGGECIAVIVGDVGLGKTLSLRMILDSLDQEKYKIALITNPGITFIQLLKEIIGQLTGKQCERSRKLELLEIFNKILFDTIDEGKKVLIFIDEANSIRPTNLESLRLLTNMQDDQRNLFSMVLAGQIELARRLEHPRRANLFQRIGTYCIIDKIQSESLVKTYVETRLKLAGGTRNIFTNDAFGPLWEYSEYGVPRLINKICKLSLKAGETNGFDVIDGKAVEEIGHRFEKVTGPAVQKRKPRKRSVESTVQNRIHDDGVVLSYKKGDDDAGKDRPEKATVEAGRKKEAQGALKGAVALVAKGGESEKGSKSHKKAVSTLTEVDTGGTPPPSNTQPMKVTIGGRSITINIPFDVTERARTASGEYRLKLAGVLAAEALKQNPHLVTSHLADPVNIWGELRESFLALFGSEKRANAM